MVTTDIVVIGGGIGGVGCAAMLADSTDVIVLEAEDVPGYHSTARSAAIFIPSYGGPEIHELTAASESYLAHPPEALNAETFLYPRGQLLLATRGQEACMDELLGSAPSVREISVDEAMARVPILEPGYLSRACLDEAARDIDVDLLLQSWSRCLRKQGGRIEISSPVQSLSRRGHSWQVSTPAQTYEARLVVNAAGAWADEVAIMAGIGALGLVPHRRSAALLPAPGGRNVTSWPLFGSVAEKWYAKPMGGKLMVSPADEDPVEPHDVYTDELVLAEGLHRYEQAVTEPVNRVEHSWAGLRTFAQDRVPVVGMDPRARGFLWLAGQGGYGVQTAPAMSQLAADIVLGRHRHVSNDLMEMLHPGRLLSDRKIEI